MLCTIAACALVAIASDAPIPIPHFKDPIPTTIAADRLAVLCHAGAAPPVVEGAEPIVDDSDAPALPPGWTILRLAAPDQPGGAERRAAVERALDAEPAVRFVSPVLENHEGWRIATPDLVVRFEPSTPRETREAILATYIAPHSPLAPAPFPGDVVRRDAFGLDGCHLIRLHARSTDEVLAAANALSRLDAVRFAEPDMLMSASPAVPSDDPSFGEQWALMNVGQPACASSPGVADVDMDVPEAWPTTTGDPELIVLVIDNGVQFDHPDLLGDPALGFDATGQGGAGWPVHPCDDHGTAIAGVIAAIAGNGLGTAGVAPNVTFASARISTVNASCSGWTIQGSWVAAAMEFGLSIGMRITNTSYTFPASSLIDDAYANADALGVLHIVAAGNGSSSQLAYPAKLPSVMAVAAITNAGAKASFSNVGTGLSFAAPGVDVTTSDRTGSEGYAPGDTCCVSGTSLACPCVAGVAALAMSANPSLTNHATRSVLRRTCVDLGAPGYDTTFGWGVPNAAAAMKAALRPADLDLDGVVDGADLGVLLSKWGSASPTGDIDGNGVVDGADLGEMLSAWSVAG